MSDSTLPSGNAHRELLFGVLAYQFDFVDRDGLHDALHEWGTDQNRSLAQVLIDRQALAPHRRGLIDQLLGEYLAAHGMDPSLSLAAACAARLMPLDLNGFASPVVRGTLATLPTLAGTLSDSTSLDPPLPRVGDSTSSGKRFRIIRAHARGALGEVFVAQDEELHREVALKQIQSPYANHADSRVRFMQEAEITGSLEHPGVVPVYGMGTYPDGRPFYAMRFIRGESLHEAIWHFHQADGPRRDPSERALALRGLLNRFVDTCNAVAYAHSRGVIHRDLKPSNIMLGPYGETLVVDWGLAKAFNRPMTMDSTETPVQLLSSVSAQATIVGQAVGTPTFMAPEQAAGRVDQVGPASDTYSLGATLYNLLTGGFPFLGNNADEVLRRVQNHDFAPPRKVKREVPAPLEAIVLKAMAFRPEDRYESVHELAQEVERWLADEPVLAYREPILDRTRRWMRRHRTLVSGITALLLTALFGLGLGLWAVRRERDVARANLSLAQKAVDECFLVATENPLLQQERMRAVRQLLLEQALPFYQGFQSYDPTDPNIRQELARNHYRRAYITAEIGSKPRALESYEEARKLAVELVRDYPKADNLRLNLAKTDNNIGNLHLEMGQIDAAEQSYLRARKQLERLLEQDPHAAEYESELARTCINLGVLYRRKRETDRALELYEKGRHLQEHLVAADPSNVRYLADLAGTWNNLGVLLADAGDDERSRKAYREARQVWERLVRGHPRVASYRSELAGTLTNLGALLAARGQSEEAYRDYDRARELLSSLVLEYPEVAEFQMDLASAWNNLGVLQQDHGKTPDALKSFQKAEQIQDSLVREHPKVDDYPIAQAGTLVNLANLLRDTDRFPECLDRYRQAFALLQGRHERYAARIVLRKAYWGRAEALGKVGRHREAAEDWELASKTEPENLRDWFLSQRALALARAGDHATATRQVLILQQETRLDPETLYNLACASAQAMAAVGRDPALGPAEQTTRSGDLARRAMTLLERAQKMGLFRDPAKRTHLQADRDLDPLRARPDGKEFLDGLMGGKPAAR